MWRDSILTHFQPDLLLTLHVGVIPSHPPVRWGHVILWPVGNGHPRHCWAEHWIAGGTPSGRVHSLGHCSDASVRLCPDTGRRRRIRAVISTPSRLCVSRHRLLLCRVPRLEPLVTAPYLIPTLETGHLHSLCLALGRVGQNIPDQKATLSRQQGTPLGRAGLLLWSPGDTAG